MLPNKSFESDTHWAECGSTPTLKLRFMRQLRSKAADRYQPKVNYGFVA